MKNFVEIFHDPFIWDIYRQIGNLETASEESLKKSGGVRHDFSHVSAVLGNVDQICNALGLCDADREEILISALLHDVGNMHGRKDHHKNGALMAEEYLNQIDMDEQVKFRIVDSIAGHGSGSETLQGKILALADKLHCTADRFYPTTRQVAPEESHGVSLLMDLKSVDVSVDGDTFIIQFTSNGNFNMDEIIEYQPLIAKIFIPIKECIESLGMKQMVLVDDIEWIVSDKVITAGVNELNQWASNNFKDGHGRDTFVTNAN